MKSRIFIDLDGNNKPFIVVEYRSSEDLRDKVVKKFLEEFGHSSNFCKIEWQILNEGPTSLDPGRPNLITHITPIGPNNIESAALELNQQAKLHTTNMV